MTYIRYGALLTLLVLLGFVLPSCGKPDVEAGGDEEAKLIVEFTGTDASDCTKDMDGSHNYTLSIAVDKIVNQTTGETEVHDFETIAVDNTSSQEFALNTPETGGFVITVLMTSNDCVSCCASRCETSPAEAAGRPTLRDFRTFFGHPGTDIVMSLDLQFCNCC